ncbi:MAG TPA: mannose-6-phosphate isomerase, class I [Polyangia bacterium]|nr:mannose-6-phosphate isomerase, class I [Polyangia bacterium]
MSPAAASGGAAAAIESWKRAPAPLPLSGGVQPYVWGQRDKQAIIPRLLGIAPVPDQPYAELWLGAHPQLPSTVSIAGASINMIELIAAAPEAVLGAPAVRRFGPQLPFLMKVLAAAQPLSIQAHPDQGQAEAGFAREEAAGIPREAPQRNYRDPRHKPELIVALGDLFALKGFRPVEEIAADFSRTPELAPLLRLPPPADETDRDRRNAARRAWVKELFTRSLSHTTETTETTDPIGAALEALVRRLETEDRVQPFGREQIEYWLLRAAHALAGAPTGRGPDRGLLSFYLLNFIHLRAGQALYLGPGELHAYLEGAGVEVMANSDNVLRGGLTPKHVDVPALLATLTFDVGTPTILQARPDGVYTTPTSEFVTARLTLSGGAAVDVDGVRGADLLLVTRGEVTLVPAPPSPVATVKAPTGRALLMPAAMGAYQIRAERAPATVFRVSIPL